MSGSTVDPTGSPNGGHVGADHHREDGGFQNPWPALEEDGREGGFLRWQRERLKADLPPNPHPHEIPRRESQISYPFAAPGETRITWIGHATCLIQIGGVNILTDPIWSKRASPLTWLGPARLMRPGVRFDLMPEISAVLVSHDHYDHLDRSTVRRLRIRYRSKLRFVTPLGYRSWLARCQIDYTDELDWWEETTLPGPEGPVRIVALPCRHWTGRSPFSSNRRLWAAWAIIPPSGQSVLFVGDSGYHPAFEEIGRRMGPFAASVLPIGAYDPRWFMGGAHMTPEEAVRAFQELGGTGVMVGTHWGTFRLSDEDPLEPPLRARAAWAQAGLPPERLWILGHGESRTCS